jgi:hypothetical protein
MFLSSVKLVRRSACIFVYKAQHGMDLLLRLATEVYLWLCGLCEMYAQQEILVKKPHALGECEGGQLVESAEQPSPVSVLDNTHFQEHEFTPNLELAKANCVSSFHGEHTIIPILS